MVNLGDRVKDQVSGFVGIAVARHTYLHGCARITVQPRANIKEAKLMGSCTFDEPQLKVVKRSVVKPGFTNTGGPDKYEDEGKPE